jgi:hypothetical protein
MGRFAPLLLVAVPLCWWAGFASGERVFLPRHSEAVDLPWAAMRTAPSTEPFNPAVSDKVNLLYPDTAFLHRQSQAGRGSAWNPWILCGVPVAANPLAGYHAPLPRLLAGLDPLLGLATQAMLALVLLGTGLYRWFRRLGLSAGLATGLALAGTASGWVCGRIQNVHLVTVVALFGHAQAGVLDLWRGARIRGSLGLALSLGLAFRSGFPQLALYVLLGAGLATLGLVATRRSAEAPSRPRFLLGAGLACLAGLLAAAPVLGSAFEALSWSGHHSRPADDLIADRLPPGAWAGLLVPDLFGPPAPEPASDLFLRALAGEGPEREPPRAANWSERSLALGPLVLTLALIGLAAGRGRTVPLLLLLTGFAAASVPEAIAALGSLPGFDVGAPARAAVLGVFGILGLAALGLRECAERGPGPWAILLTLLGLLAAALATVAGLWPEGTGSAWAAIAEAGDRGPIALPRAEVAHHFAAHLGPWRSTLWRLVAVALPAGLLAFLARRPARRRPILALLLALALADLGEAFLRHNRPVRADGNFVETPAIRHLREELGTDRFLRAAQRSHHHLFPPNLGILFGLRDAQGYREQVRQDLIRAWAPIASASAPVGFAGIPEERLGDRLLDLAAVRYVVAVDPLSSPAVRPHDVPGARPGDLLLYENPDAGPRVWLAPRARAATMDACLAALHEDGPDPRRELPIYAPPPGLALPEGAAGDGSAAITLDEADRVRVEGRCGHPAVLVLADAFDLGWEAVLEQADRRTSVPVLQACGIFRGVVVPEGAWAVEFRYRPPGARLHGVLVATAVLPLLLGLGLGRRRDPARAPRENQAG